MHAKGWLHGRASLIIGIHPKETMASKLLKLRVGVADDPSALQPSLNDCLEAMLEQSDGLVQEVLQAMLLGSAASGPRRIAGFQKPGVKACIEALNKDAKAVQATFKKELTRLVYEGGGKEIVQTELLRYEDLQLFEEAQLDQSIEIARAQQEVASAVDDSLPTLDALISTMLGWRTIQPGLNPLRPDVFVKSLQFTLAEHVTDASIREAIIAPAAGLMGVTLRKLYREVNDWLRSTGVEPAVPLGGRVQKGLGSAGVPVNDSAAKTLLTLDRLRKLLVGDFDQPKGKQDFMHTVPASMSLLQELKKADELIKRLEERPKPTPAPQAPVDMLSETAPSAATKRIGQELGQEVVRLMFDNLTQDGRLLPGFKRQLKVMEPAIQKLTKEDSRFFSDRNHPARQMLDRITQRSLAFASENDAGWSTFMDSVHSASQWLDSKVVDSDTFGELLDNLQDRWSGQDQGAKHKREEAAKALLHAEQRNLLAQKLAAEFDHMLEGLDVADFIRDFLKGSWAQVVAEAQLSCEDGSNDPFGYRALVDDLVWSVQKTSAQRGRARRLVQMIPGILERLREGLQRIGYPPELTQRFFDHLITLHRAAVQEGADAASKSAQAAQAEADAAWNEESKFSDSAHDEIQMWLDENEVVESGFVHEEDIELDFTHAASAEAAEKDAELARKEAAVQEAIRREVAQKAAEAKAETGRKQAAAEEAARKAAELRSAAEKAEQERLEEERLLAEWEQAKQEQERAEAAAQDEAARLQAEWEEAKRVQQQADAAAREVEAAAAAAEETRAAATGAAAGAAAQAGELRMGTWVEIQVKGEWVRAQLTWSSPHNTLFMFTSITGTAHSMSRRTLDKLRATNHLKVVADRPVVDEALDQVAQAALKNSIDKKE
jgi:hypothetical protein